MTATALFELDTELDPRALFDHVVAAWRGERDGYEVFLRSTRDRGVQFSTFDERPKHADADALSEKVQTSLDELQGRAQPPPPAPSEKAWISSAGDVVPWPTDAQSLVQRRKTTGIDFDGHFTRHGWPA